MTAFTAAAFRFRTMAFALFVLLALLAPRVSAAQVTTGSIRGIVIDTQKHPVAGASVVAIHIPSGTNYEGSTRADGRFEIPNLRVGGPYSVVVSPAPGATGGLTFKATTQDNITVNLGAATDLTFDVQPMVAESVNVVAQSDTVFNSQRTGAATTVTRDQLATLPTISGRLTDITRLSPQSGGTLTFAGADPRFNNITVDGSYFNNSFGIRNSPGDTSGVAPISLSAIEQVQVNIAPYDVRQGNFVGAAVNTVTRSGGNTFHGSYSHATRNQNWVGTTARGLTFNPGTFDFRNDSLWGSGPIKQNKAFFFVNYDNEAFTQPGTTFRANTGGETAVGNVTRVLASDLDALSTFMKTNFNYDTGPYQNYDFNTPAIRFLAKSDINLNDHNKLAIRYNHLDSNTDILVSNSSSVGFGTRRGNTNSLNFANSNYIQLENIRSIVGEVNSIIGQNMANNLIVGYTTQNENREYTTPTIFPMIDILQSNLVYTTMGFEPFTPKNQLVYNTFQVQNNFQEFAKNHTLTFGVSFERYNSRNVFYPASQSVYVYSSLNDFYTDTQDYLANPNRTTSPITLRRFDLRWNNIPGQEEPVQPLHVTYISGYVQDDWRIKSRLTLNIGLRWDAPYFAETGFANANADALTFQDESGKPVQYKTGELPGSHPLWSPRVGFNWDVNGDQMTQVRGGSGIFSGKPAYVWISNQVGNTGMLTGTERIDFTKDRPFNPDPDHYKPTNVTGAPATSYNLELIDGNFRFPQIWRTNIAVDRKLPWGMTGTFDAIFNEDIHGIYYINANLPTAQTTFTGADQRLRWTGTACGSTGTVGPCSNRINNTPGNIVSTAVVLKNQNIGHGWDVSGVLEKRLSKGLWVKGAYHYGEAHNTVDPGSIATGSWTANQISNDPNNPGLSFASNSPAHRIFVVGSYNHDFFKFGTTTVSMFWDSHTNGNTSYTFPVDANGDGGTSNDLIYIARDTSEMYFQQYTSTVTGVTYTSAVQAAAWDAYIKQDRYLSQHRGEYVVRNSIFLPLVHRLDFSASQDVKVKVGSVRHAVQFRVDIENFTNLLNHNWGTGQRLVNTQPLTDPSADAQGRLQYRLREVNGALMDHTFERTAGLTDVYRIMFSIRYSF